MYTIYIFSHDDVYIQEQWEHIYAMLGIYTPINQQTLHVWFSTDTFDTSISECNLTKKL